VHPDGSRVLFESNADGNLNLWSMNLDGSNRTPLTFGEAQKFWARWSPDGQTIAYGSEQDGNLQVWVMDADGQNARQLTHRGNTNYAPSFSPDGSWIAYVSSEGDSSFVYKIPAEGGDPVLVSEIQAIMSAQWSPDGRWIAAWSAGRPGSPQQEIVLLPTQEDESEHRFQVNVQRAEMRNLAWHPHGGISIALTTHGTMNVHVLDVPGGTPRQITDFEADEILFAHDWAPDGTFLIAQRGVFSSDIVLLENLP
jgi:Tol biopolymer transport system component